MVVGEWLWISDRQEHDEPEPQELRLRGLIELFRDKAARLNHEADKMEKELSGLSSCVQPMLGQ